MKHSKKLLGVVAAFGLALTSLATQAASLTPVQTQDIATIGQQLENRHSLKADKITPSPITGVYEVWLNGHPIYTDAKMEYLIDGDMFDALTQENITDRHRKVLSKEQFGKLPFDLAVKQVFGKGERRLVVFSDPSCTYCRILEQTFSKVDNLTVYTFVVSVLPPGPVSVSDILCAPDPAKAWEEWMGKGIEPKKQPEACDRKSSSVIGHLASRYELRGVPMLLFPNGETLSGALSASQLDQMLNKNQ